MSISYIDPLRHRTSMVEVLKCIEFDEKIEQD